MQDEDEGLTDIFKARLGLDGMEEVNQITEIELALEEERDKTLSAFLFQKFAKNFRSGASANFTKDRLQSALLPKKHSVDELVCGWVGGWVGLGFGYIRKQV